MTEIDLYTRDGCTHCENVKKILKSRSIPYTEHKLITEDNVKAVKELFPKASQLPIIAVNGKWVEHLSDLRYLIEG